jgi:hypothetical protein
MQASQREQWNDLGGRIILHVLQVLNLNSFPLIITSNLLLNTKTLQSSLNFLSSNLFLYSSSALSSGPISYAVAANFALSS